MPKQTQGLFKKPNSSYWYADFTDASGRRVKRSTRTVDRKEADALLAKWKLEAHRQAMWDEEPPRLYDDLMLRYLQGPSMDKRAHDRDLYAAKKLPEEREAWQHSAQCRGGRRLGTAQDASGAVLSVMPVGLCEPSRRANRQHQERV